MAYIYTWNSTFESKPADIDNISDGATEIRKFKVAVRERFAKDHYFDTAGTDANHGEHSKVTLQEQSGKPLAEVNKGYLYTKEVSGKAELFWEDEDEFPKVWVWAPALLVLPVCVCSGVECVCAIVWV